MRHFQAYSHPLPQGYLTSLCDLTDKALRVVVLIIHNGGSGSELASDPAVASTAELRRDDEAAFSIADTNYEDILHNRRVIRKWLEFTKEDSKKNGRNWKLNNDGCISK